MKTQFEQKETMGELARGEEKGEIFPGMELPADFDLGLEVLFCLRQPREPLSYETIAAATGLSLDGIKIFERRALNKLAYLSPVINARREEVEKEKAEGDGKRLKAEGGSTELAEV
jgi:hypothetical protein